MPPLLHAPSREAVNKGLEVVENSKFDPTTSHAIRLPIAHLLSAKGEVSRAGASHVTRLSRILQRQQVQLTLEVSTEQNLEPVLAFAKRMIDERGVEPTHIAISMVDPRTLPPDALRLVVNRTERR